MNCPTCRAGVELTWARYLKSVSGRHACPRCATVFRFRTDRRYWLLWLDVVAAALITGYALDGLFVSGAGVGRASRAGALIVVAVPIVIWGAVFLVLNRRALNRLDTRAAGRDR